ncbi:hypothetical protein LJC68_06780 [Bacteroidales bacterium OttesenSCG-928-B11]|nr:hypothetical protein [Bacteroidales bacterium OttesenSCG-928-E04]MDL2312565.1 hypothetical protein [Bacteroidales bacterium OttesenSCG-928-B11]MDL2325828.1 hypothetical protein [Bacteroidales bacterium OttesenSCG-928-A14]
MRIITGCRTIEEFEKYDFPIEEGDLLLPCGDNCNFSQIKDKIINAHLCTYFQNGICLNVRSS